MKLLLTTLTVLLGGVAFAQTSPAPATPAPAAAPATAVTPAPDPKTVVARIGAREITYAEFEQAFRIAVARVVNNQGIPFSEDIYNEFASARADYLKQFVRDQALYQVAEGSVKADTAAIDTQIAEVRKKFQNDDDYKRALAQTGYGTEEAFRTYLTQQQVVSAYLGSLKDRFKFGDNIVAGYYNLNRPKFNRPAEACAKHILVDTEAAAKDIVKSLGAGGDFAKIAQEKSKDPGSGKQGGDLGCYGPGTMVPSFDKASFSGPLTTPQVVQSQFGWHVLIVTKRTAAGVLPLDQAAPLIRDQMSREAAQKYVDAQIAKIKVESFPEVFGPAKK